MASLQHHGLPSPATTANSPAASHAGPTSTSSPLPLQRQHALTPGSPKEIALISYVDDRVLYITRRYATKYTNISTKARESPGYTSFEEFIADLNPLIDLVWTTGTPTLQIPYLLTFAGLVASYMPAFPFTKRCLEPLRRLDTAFASLLHDWNSVSASRHIVSVTEKVRIKSLVNETRVTAIRQASSAGLSTEDENDTDYDDGDEDTEIEDDTDDSSRTAGYQSGEAHAKDDATGLQLSKIYESTITILGGSLAQPTMLVQQDDSMDTS